jgi:carbamoyltransferase
MKAVEHEFKVMGLAPYAKDDRAYNILKTLIYLEDGNFKAKIPAREFEQFLKENLYRVRFDSIAYGLQKLTEELVPAWIKYWVDKTGISDIALGGGVFMNVKLNMLLCDTYKNLFVYPSCGDESLALGSCYYGHKYLGESGIEPLGSLYFGPEYSDEQVEAAIKNRGLKFTKHKDIASKIAKLLKSGKIVASFAGRMEWGARALGNRSILADPRKLENIKIINEAIKQRDFWMPFAPAILEERTADYIENPRTAPYMILAFRSTELSRKNLAATMHPYDHTVRPQIVNSKSNARFYKIIKEFEKLTGCGVVLNTSFNLHGYPIVMTPEDALYVFENSGLNYLAMNNYLVEKTA